MRSRGTFSLSEKAASDSWAVRAALSSGRVAQAGAEGGEFVEAVGGLAGGPGDAAEGEEAENGVVEGPVVVAGQGDEDAVGADGTGPKLGAQRAVFLGTGEELHVGGLADEGPVGFVDEVGPREIRGSKTARERVIVKHEIDGAVAVLGGFGVAGEAEAARETGGGETRLDSPVEIGGATPAVALAAATLNTAIVACNAALDVFKASSSVWLSTKVKGQ